MDAFATPTVKITSPEGLKTTKTFTATVLDVLTAKGLIDRMGVGPLRTLIDGLAK